MKLVTSHWRREEGKEMQAPPNVKTMACPIRSNSTRKGIGGGGGERMRFRKEFGYRGLYLWETELSN